MRHKWILLMCAGVILMLVTIANPVAGYSTNSDGAQTPSAQIEQATSTDKSLNDHTDSATVRPPKNPQLNEEKSGDNTGAKIDPFYSEETSQRSENTTKNQTENGTHANNETDVESFSTTETSNSGTIIEHATTPRDGKAIYLFRTTQKPSSVCTKSGLNYDCIFNNIKLGQNETQNFGLSWKNNPEKNVTFEDSRLAYLPKKLIEAFPQMELLNAEDLQMEQIEERAFSKAANLKFLYLKKNMFTTINQFTGVPELVHLDLSNNRIKHINRDAFQNNQKLEIILLNNNLISVLPKTNAVDNLTILNVANNEINQISDHQFIKNNKLENLNVSFNHLTHFDLVQFNDKPLYIIDLSHNKLERLHIPTEARILKAANNSIQVLTVDECYAERLDLSRNLITDVSALQKCRDLKKLDLSHNHLQSFNLIKSYPKLSNLNLAQNQLFEIDFPPYFHQLQTLDLSYNHLSFGPANKFTQMKNMKLNNNKFIEFKFATINQLNYLQMNNNEWDCGRIKEFIKAKAEYVTDTTEVCHGRKSLNGICCKDYKRAFNDRLTEIMRETFVHKNVNRQDEQDCKQAEPVSQGVGKQEIQKLHANTAILDSASKKILDRIEQTKIKYDDIVNQITADQSKKSALKEKLKNYKRIVHKLREHYGVINEGLISTNLTLNRVLQFTEERNILSKDLLARRVQEVQQTETRFNNLMDTINAANNLNAKLKEDLTILKSKESSAKKERLQLEKTVNRNSPSLHGSKG